MHEFGGAPEFINDKGVRFWFNSVSSNYAISKGFNSYLSWCIQLPKSEKSLILVDNTTNNIIYECSSLNTLHTYIDQLFFEKIK